MSKAGQFGEPWAVDVETDGASENTTAAEIRRQAKSGDKTESIFDIDLLEYCALSEKTARRIVACVNALAGLSDEALSQDPIAKAREALRTLLDRDMRNTCEHEETHRGGILWEICDSCGTKWADDEGGKPEWKNPPEWDKARAALALLGDKS